MAKNFNQFNGLISYIIYSKFEIIRKFATIPIQSYIKLLNKNHSKSREKKLF